MTLLPFGVSIGRTCLLMNLRASLPRGSKGYYFPRDTWSLDYMSLSRERPPISQSCVILLTLVLAVNTGFFPVLSDIDRKEETPVSNL